MVRIIEQPRPRLLVEDDFRLMNLPLTFREARLSWYTEPAKTRLTTYLSKRLVVMGHGLGLIVRGPGRCGKSSALAGVLKTFRAFGYHAYYTSPLQLREMQANRVMFDDGRSFLQMCMDINLLAIDDVAEENLGNPVFGVKDFKQLVKYRRDWSRPTIIATSIDPSEPLPKFLESRSRSANLVEDELESMGPVIPLALPLPGAPKVQAQQALSSLKDAMFEVCLPSREDVPSAEQTIFGSDA